MKYPRALAMIALTVMLFTFQSVMADEAKCTKAYRKANTNYFKEVEGLKKRKRNATGAMIVGGGLSALCMIGTKAYTACSVAGGVIMGPAYFVHARQAHKIEDLDQARQIYQVYDAVVTKAGPVSEEYSKFIDDLGIESDREAEAGRVLVELMDAGAFCDSTGTDIDADYEAVVTQVKAKLSREG